MEQYSFEKLLAYQYARKLVRSVYALLEKFPDKERYSLADQLRRAVISVPSNLAEGSGRISNKEKIHFIEIAYGSLMEVYCQLDIACDLLYVTEEEVSMVKEEVRACSRMMTALRKSFIDQGRIKTSASL